MKCVSCGSDAKYKDRKLLGTCISCGKKFVFEPQTGDPFTDVGFQAMIDRVSGNATVKFSSTNLFYEVKRIKKSKAPVVAITAIAAVVSLGLLLGGQFIGGAITALATGVLYMLLSNFGNPLRNLSRSAFNDSFGRWREVHGDPPGLLKPKQLPAQASAHLQAELETYSFDRAVITDIGATAELLLANDFHFENNCAVLSIDGTPAHAFEAVRRMLRKNPRLEVFALHDATTEGCTLAFRLKHDPAWFKEFGTVRDVALRPAQARARAFKGLWQPHRELPDPHSSISPSEMKWLSQWTLPLAAIRPEQLIKRLYRAMHLPSGGDDNWSEDAVATDGGADSFG